ncbi:nitronate monooxygenase [Arthrobacter sp. H20]|uniref:nitronate monooxygenase n=1 Tax=Arthrobacter sp. H20 TaxID=1267981 RepID=UPI0004B045F1|nr:nitronate monooxygenase [Arthrobacter sp. H20]
MRKAGPLLPSPILVAPMAGGVSTPALVTAVARGGGLGFLAAGYKPVAAIQSEISEVRANGLAFGVNLFVPGPPTIDTVALQAYRTSLGAMAARLGVALPEPTYDDDAWGAKIDFLLAEPVPFVSLTFGLPDREIIRALKERGTVVIATVTRHSELLSAQDYGVDAAVLQHSAAGGHSAAFAPDAPPGAPFTDVAALTSELFPHSTIPLIAAGGLTGASDINEALAAGAAAVQLGTLLVRTHESGAPQLHKDALASPTFQGTALTRAFSGRPARGLENQFMRDHRDAPAGYPELHHVTSPLRAAAATAGDPDAMALWAGTGYRAAPSMPAAELVSQLVAGLDR